MDETGAEGRFADLRSPPVRGLAPPEGVTGDEPRVIDIHRGATSPVPSGLDFR